jgi:hypothetical protein
MTNSPSDAPLDFESEEALIKTARNALSRCNWVIGQCATQWTQRYSKGRTDSDFGNLVGLSGDQIYQRRRVWEKFHDVYQEYGALSWSHFYLSINWEDSAECLQWAQDQDATVAEMKAWRRAMHGEDLKSPGEDAPFEAIGGQYTEVRDTDGPPFEANEFGGGASAGDREWSSEGDDWAMSAPAMAGMNQRIPGENAPYSPFSSEARGNRPESDGNSAAAKAMSPEEIIEKTLRRCLAQMTKAAQMMEDHPEIIERLPDELKEDFDEAVSRISKAAKSLV